MYGPSFIPDGPSVVVVFTEEEITKLLLAQGHVVESERAMQRLRDGIRAEMGS